MARAQESTDRDSARDPAAAVRPPRFPALSRAHVVARNVLGLMSLRAATIAAKFALTLFIAHYLGLAPLGTYGIIASATVLAPVLLGFGVSSNLGREAMHSSPAAITVRLLQYFVCLVPAYVAMFGLALPFAGEAPVWIALLCLLLFLEHIQLDLFTIMVIAGLSHRANLIFFIRSAGWALVYMPLAALHPDFRNLKVMGLFWLAGDLAATILAVALTPKWGWLNALRSLPTAKVALPHTHGSKNLYFDNVANTAFVYVDRYVIGLFLSAETLGAYTFFWTIVNAMSNLVNIAVVLTKKGELLQIAHASPLAIFNRTLRKLAINSGQMAIGLSVLAIALVHFALPYVRRPELVSEMPIIYFLCGSLVLRTVYEVLGISFYAYSRDDILLYSGAAILVLSLVMNLTLVPVAGIWGACVASLASYAVGVAARGSIISRGFRPAVGRPKEA